MDESDQADTPGQSWSHTLREVGVVLTPRGSGQRYRDDDAHRRSPWALGAILEGRGAQWDRNMVTPLPAEYVAPDLSPEEVYRVLEDVCLMNPGKYGPTGFGRGGRLPQGAPDDPSGIYYQLAEGRPEIDGGLYDDFTHYYGELEARSEALNPTERLWRRRARRLLEWYRTEKDRLSENDVEVTQLHIPVYFRPADFSGCHIDVRVNHPRSRRAIYSCVKGVPLNERRLTFFVGEEKDSGEYSWKKLENATAYCYGRAGGNVLMTGQGSGGVWLVPAGETTSGRPVYMWHEPYSRRVRAVGMRASLVLSGFKRE